MRTRLVMVLGVLMAAGLALAGPALAQDGGEVPTTDPALEGAVGIGDNLLFTGAVVTPPAGDAPRTFDAYQAAVFVQSWLPQSIYGGHDIELQEPPDLPVARVDVTGQWGPGNVGTMTVYFATDGTTAYVAFPQDQPVAPEPGGPPPPQVDWFTAPARAIEAFNGEAELIETTGTQQATSTTSAAPGAEAASSATDATDFPVVWVGVVVALGAVVAIGLVLRQRRA